MMCLRRFDKSRYFCDDFCCCRRVACEGYEDNIIKEPENLKDARDNSLDYSVVGSSSSSCTIIPFDAPLPHVADSSRTKESCTLKGTFEDFEKAIMKVRPSAMGECRPSEMNCRPLVHKL